MTRFAKALAAFFTTATGSAAQVYADNVVEQGEVVIAVLTVLAATAAVYALPNTVDRPELHADESVVSTPDA
jgi:uncharacterized membrane protein